MAKRFSEPPRRLLTADAVDRMTDAQLETALGFDEIEDDGAIELELFGTTLRPQPATPREETIRVSQAGPPRRRT